MKFIIVTEKFFDWFLFLIKDIWKNTIFK
jgi:hypothetical protein